jgi:hypothetical protein
MTSRRDSRAYPNRRDLLKSATAAGLIPALEPLLGRNPQEFPGWHVGRDQRQPQPACGAAAR